MAEGPATRLGAAGGAGVEVPAPRPSRLRYGAAKSVGTFVPQLTQKAFERFGFPAAAILTDWSGIVGPELARFTAPERLKWPRASDTPEDGGEEGESRVGPTGATLVLRVDGPRAIELQYKAPQLIERINAYFGFRAVGELRILQAPLANRDVRRPAVARPPVKPREAIGLAPARDGGLGSALEQLGQSVRWRKSLPGKSGP